jgi:hypothetical protein
MTMKLTALTLAGVAMLALAACGPAPELPAAPANTPAETAAASAEPATPPVVDGWREYPLRDGVVSIQPGKWRTDVIDVPVPAGKGLEYKLAMKKGQGVVYSVSYGALEHPGLMVVEFHGHTEQVDGAGDLMYYSKTGGTPESGVFTAPWDGIHGWYLKNESDKDVVAKLELAGFYELEAK